MSNALARARVTIDLAVAYQDLLQAPGVSVIGGSDDRSLGSHGVRLLLYGELTRAFQGALRGSALAPYIGEPHIQVELSTLREPR